MKKLSLKRVTSLLIAIILAMPVGITGLAEEATANASIYAVDEANKYALDEANSYASDEANIDALDDAVDDEAAAANDTNSDDTIVFADDVDPEVGETNDLELGGEDGGTSDDDGAVTTFWFMVGDALYSEQTVGDGEALTQPEDPEAPEGMAFSGWFLEDGTQLFAEGAETAMTGDSLVNVMARFEEETVSDDLEDTETDTSSNEENADDLTGSDATDEGDGSAETGDTPVDEEDNHAPVDTDAIGNTNPNLEDDAENSDGTITTPEMVGEEGDEDSASVADKASEADENPGEKNPNPEKSGSDENNGGIDENVDGMDETALPVRVAFTTVPEEAVVRVFGAPDSEGHSEEMVAEEDGSFLLLPGEYRYNAEAEGYAVVDGVVFTVAEEALTIAVALEAIPETPEPVEEDEEDEEDEQIQPVAVTFVVEPETAIIKVYPSVTEGEAEPIPAEEDGTYLLLPGEYTYNASAEGYLAAEAVPFTVADEPLTISIELEAVEGEMVPFDQSKTLNGVIVRVQAEPGVFPANAELSVTRVPVMKRREADAAIDEIRDEDVNVAVSYTFDIKVVDAETREELQPGEGQSVSVSFALGEVADGNLETAVYHVTEEETTGELIAKSLDVTTEVTPESGEETTATVETEGFSIYQVEFTYENLEYVMQGDTSVALSEILDFVGLTGEATAVEISDESLFSASDESGAWIITAHRAFSSTEWMKVTINGVEYEITVTDNMENDGLTWDTALNPENWGDLQTAFNRQELCYVKLEKSITCGEGGTALNVASDKTIYLDLNGHTIDRGLTSAENNGNVISVFGDLTVQDSSKSKTGKITGGKNSNMNIYTPLTNRFSGGGVFVYKNGHFTLTGGSVSGNTASLHGGGVYVMESGTLTLSGGAICDNTAEINGGGVYVHNATFNMKGGNVTGNTAYDKGGGIYLNGGEIMMSGGTIGGIESNEKNHSGSSGGGVYVGNGSFMLSSGSIFGNGANDQGGGVYLNGGSFTMNGGSISTNAAMAHGGGVYFNRGTFDFSGEAQITGNTADDGNGGGIYVSGGTFNMSGTSKISDNTCKSYGGGVYLGDGTMTMYGNAMITGNTAGINGGGASVSKNNFHVYGAPKISGNHGADDSIAENNVFLSSSITIQVDNSLDNTARIGVSTWPITDGYIPKTITTGFSGKGVAGNFYSDSMSLRVRTNSSSEAEFYKPDFWLINRYSLTNGSLTATINGQNVAQDKDIHAAKGDIITLTPVANDGYMYLENSLKVTKMDDESVVVPLTGNTFTMPDYFVKVTATFSAWKWLKKELEEGHSIKLDKDYKDTYNEGLLVVPTGATVTLDLSGHTIDRGLTSATPNGNVITVNGNLSLTDSGTVGTITGGNNAGNGGCMIVNNGGTFTMTGGTISGNKATGANDSTANGGGIYATQATLEITGGVISNNEITGNGGGLYIDRSSVSFSKSDNGTGCTISGNTATDSGGGVYITGSTDRTVNLADLTVSGNKAVIGGGVCVSSCGIGADNPTIQLTDVVIQKNGPVNSNNNNQGGGIYVNLSKVTLTGCTIGGSSENANTAAHGGGIYANNSVIEIDQSSKISYNSVTQNGGGIYAYNNSTLEIDQGSEISYNTATQNGGGLCVKENSNLNLYGVKINGNSTGDASTSGNYGGGLYVGGQCPITLTDVIISGNQSADGGGMYYINNDNTEVNGQFTRVTISGNHAVGNNYTGIRQEGKGGGLLVRGTNAKVTLSGCTIGGSQANANTASCGAGVYVAGSGTLEFGQGSEISYNVATSGGGVYVTDAGTTFAMSGGKIRNNRIDDETGSGGGVYLNNGTFRLSGGEITGNTVSGVVVNGGTFEVSGAPAVTGNTASDVIAAASNVFLSTGKSIKVSGALTTGEGANKKNASIGVTLQGEDDAAFTSGYGFEKNGYNEDIYPEIDGTHYFFDDTGEKTVGLMKLGSGTDEKAEVALLAPWPKLQSDILFKNPVNGVVNIELESDVNAGDADGALKVPAGRNVEIDLNGKTIKGKLGDVFIVNGTLTVTDSGTNGAITHETGMVGRGVCVGENSGIQGKFILQGGSIRGNNAINGGGVYVNGGCAFEMNGGIIGSNTASYGGGLYVANNGSFRMTGGEITGNIVSTGFGGGVVVLNGILNMIGGKINGNSAVFGGGVYVVTGTFNMNGGEIKNNKATGIDDANGRGGGGVYVTSGGSFEITGGSIEQNTATSKGGGVFMGGSTFKASGAPIIAGNALSSDNSTSNVLLANGTSITTNGNLKTGAKIGVSLAEEHTDKTFTDKYSTYNANVDPSTFFTSDDAAYGVGWNDGFTNAMLGKRIEYSPATAYSGIYDGAAHKALTVSVIEPKSGAKVEYSTDGKTFTQTIPSVTRVGEYPIYYRISAEGYLGASGMVSARISAKPTPAPAPAPAPVVAPAPAPAPSGPTITIPKVPASVKVKAKKSKVTVSWKKIKKTKKTKALLAQIKGIEVQYSTDPTFASDVNTKTLGKKKTKVTLKLQKKTVYYIRVRYTDGAGGVSNWSKVRKVKTK